jgi:hypothetical protein
MATEAKTLFRDAKMKSRPIVHIVLAVPLLAILLSSFSACGPYGEDASTSVFPGAKLPNGNSLAKKTGPNILPLTVNGSKCAPGSYINKPCVSVTLCGPESPARCVTLDDILVDTGSYGLRVFNYPVLQGEAAPTSSPLTTTLGLAPQAANDGSSRPVYECVHFGDGSSVWGPVAPASVILGGEPPVTVPVQIIDASNAGSNCDRPESSPTKARYNGILGVGLAVRDCGLACTIADPSEIKTYFACTGSECAPVAVPLDNQVQNPVAALPDDNNGVIIELPQVPLGGISAIEGRLVLGIGTRENNSPASDVLAFKTDSRGAITTEFRGKLYPSILDSGSNGIFFPDAASMPDCAIFNPNLAGFFCPPSVQNFAANNSSKDGAPSAAVSFFAGNAFQLATSGGSVFVEMTGDSSGAIGDVFDWGLPFFFGRNVYVGFVGRRSILGKGPYWAY